MPTMIGINTRPTFISPPQVNYCQGMAFVAGVILMYLPEEPAFRMLMSLMAESRANLRRLFTPGLEGLKAELRKFEWLMQRHFPALAAHLVVRITRLFTRRHPS